MSHRHSDDELTNMKWGFYATLALAAAAITLWGLWAAATFYLEETLVFVGVVVGLVVACAVFCAWCYLVGYVIRELPGEVREVIGRE